MKTLYIECSSGAAGDMLGAALFELLPCPDEFIKKLNNMFSPKIVFTPEKSEKSGISGTHMQVLIGGEEEGEPSHHHHHDHHHHHHTSFNEIKEIVSNLEASNRVKQDIISVYDIIAQAESKAHGVSVEEVHFHEVGALDAVADIAAFCLMLEEISPEKIIVSPINIGFGTVKCAHGILPVPAPATAEILKGIPTYTNEIEGELCTPTGAALLSRFADEFAYSPEMKTEKIGYGIGKKDLSAPNCIRAFLGESTSEYEQICELSCNIDDMTAEEIAFACECFFENGAKDVYTSPISMKKSRLATKITVLCKKQDKENMLSLMFKHTTTLGIRETAFKRYYLTRKSAVIASDFGQIGIKHSEGFGTSKSKAEYDDIAKIAREQNISFREAKKILNHE